MPLFDSFRIDLATHDWRLAQLGETVRIFVNPNRDFLQQRLILTAPPDLPPDYPNLESQRAYFEAMSPAAGFAIIAVELIAVKGAEGFTTLFKFRNPENRMGARILGTVMFTFETFFCGFQFQADEHGTTGMREAAAYIILEKEGNLPPEVVEAKKLPPRHITSLDEYFKEASARPPFKHFADDERFDAAFPQHPLSRVRSYMKHVMETIEFDTEVRRAKPFRGQQVKMKRPQPPIRFEYVPAARQESKFQAFLRWFRGDKKQ
jgi:hypothetical protein